MNSEVRWCQLPTCLRIKDMRALSDPCVDVRATWYKSSRLPQNITTKIYLGLSFSCSLHKKMPSYYCIVLCYQKWYHWQHNSFCIICAWFEKSLLWMVVWLHKQREEIQAAAYLSSLSYTAVAVNFRGEKSLLWKLRKHQLKEILVSQNSVDLVWCLWSIFPHCSPDGGEGFYGGLTFLPTDTQGQHCSSPLDAHAEGVTMLHVFHWHLGDNFSMNLEVKIFTMSQSWH